jgi:hypothetical protein
MNFSGDAKSQWQSCSQQKQAGLAKVVRLRQLFVSNGPLDLSFYSLRVKSKLGLQSRHQQMVSFLKARTELRFAALRTTGKLIRGSVLLGSKKPK